MARCFLLHLFLRLLLVAQVSALPVFVLAQDPVQDTSLLLQDRVALLVQRIAAADSSGDVSVAVTARLDLALLVKPTHALRLDQEAAVLADSTDVAPDLPLRAHRALVDMYTARGEMTKANREWAQVLSLTEEVLKRQASVALEQEHATRAQAGEREDSLMGVIHAERAMAQAAHDTLTAEYQRRTELAIMAIAAGFILLLASLFLFTRYVKRLRNELQELRQEVSWLRMVGRKVTGPTPEQPPIAPPPPAPTPVVATVPPPERSEEDAMLLELVRRRGAERLTTLREARQRGDREKVQRVVHSLKPQLASIDARRFTDLCARLVSPEADGDNGRWNADLDALEAGIEQVLSSRP